MDRLNPGSAKVFANAVPDFIHKHARSSPACEYRESLGSTRRNPLMVLEVVLLENPEGPSISRVQPDNYLQQSFYKNLI